MLKEIYEFYYLSRWTFSKQEKDWRRFPRSNGFHEIIFFNGFNQKWHAKRISLLRGHRQKFGRFRLQTKPTTGISHALYHYHSTGTKYIHKKVNPRKLKSPEEQNKLSGKPLPTNDFQKTENDIIAICEPRIW